MRIGKGRGYSRVPYLLKGFYMLFLMTLIDVPAEITIDILSLVKVCVVLMGLAGLIWVARKCIKTVNRF